MTEIRILTTWATILHDEHIRKAITVIHEEPGAEWTVEHLAQKAELGEQLLPRASPN